MIEINQKINRIYLKLKAFKMGEDLCIILTGGKEHIGAVTAFHDGKVETITFSSHKERFITEKISDIFIRGFIGHFVICCGIHFDNITKEEISSVENISCEMAKILCEKLKYSN